MVEETVRGNAWKDGGRVSCYVDQRGMHGRGSEAPQRLLGFHWVNKQALEFLSKDMKPPNQHSTEALISSPGPETDSWKTRAFE